LVWKRKWSACLGLKCFPIGGVETDARERERWLQEKVLGSTEAWESSLAKLYCNISSTQPSPTFFSSRIAQSSNKWLFLIGKKRRRLSTNQCVKLKRFHYISHDLAISSNRLDPFSKPLQHQSSTTKQYLILSKLKTSQWEASVSSLQQVPSSHLYLRPSPLLGLYSAFPQI